jgi:hypothetical protein
VQVRIPFVNNSLSGDALWEEAYENEKHTLSGVYPLVIRFMWHTGIHLSNKTNDIKSNFIKPIVDGEIIAYKLASDYSILPLESKIIHYSRVDELTKKLNNAKDNYPIFFNKEIAPIVRPSGDVSDVSVDEVVKKIKAPNADIDEYKEALSKALTPFSTSFVLTRHVLKLNNREEIKYFILYSNLAPISDYDISEQEICRTFFPKWVLSKEETEQAIIEEDKKDKVCICDEPIPTADIDYLGMQGFIYNNSVHIELFMPSLEGFKTNSSRIDYTDLQNEVYCFKGGERIISMRMCGEEELYREDTQNEGAPSDAVNGTPVIIVHNNSNNQQRVRDATSGYNRCQCATLLERMLLVHSNGRGRYWFSVGEREYNLGVEVNTASPQRYIKLINTQEVQLDGGGWIRRGEMYLANEFPLDLRSLFPVQITISVLKEKMNDCPEWYAFSKDLEDCQNADIDEIRSSSYRIQSYDKLPEQRYTGRWYTDNVNSYRTYSMENIFPAEGIRIRYSDTVRTGTSDNALVRIKHENKYYFFRSSAARRINLLSESILYRNYPIMQYHILGLPFFSKPVDNRNDLKCDVRALNTIIAYDLERRLASIAEFHYHENFADAVYQNDGLYKALNTVIVQCPSYWEYKENINPVNYGFHNLYTENQKEKYRKYIKEQLWMTDEVKEAMDTSNVRSFYYFHPINFLKYVCGELRMEFNPYFGRHIKPTMDEYPDIEVKSNPGFAPVLEIEEGKEDSYGFLGPDGTRYAHISRGMVKEPDGPEDHKGVDFVTYGRLSPIQSFIYGTVWAVTWQGDVGVNSGSGYGYMLIVKNDREDKLYVLGHLSKTLVNVGDHVIPGQIVANTGSTGNSSGPHLHLEVRLCSSKKEDVLSPDGNKKNEQEGAGLSWSGETIIVDPFDHERRYDDL